MAYLAASSVLDMLRLDTHLDYVEVGVVELEEDLDLYNILLSFDFFESLPSLKSHLVQLTQRFAVESSKIQIIDRLDLVYLSTMKHKLNEIAYAIYLPLGVVAADMHREESAGAVEAKLVDLMDDLEVCYAVSANFVLVCSWVDP